MARAFVRRAGPQRQFVWSEIVISAFSIALGTAKVAGTGLGVSTGGGITLMRTRGRASVHFDPTSAGDVVQYGIGLGVFTSDAFAAGSASLPGPLTDIDYDWIWHTVGMMGPSFTATEDGTNILHNLWIELDSKAMRKLKPNQTVGFMLEGSIKNGGGTLDLSVAARQLFKLG